MYRNALYKRARESSSKLFIKYCDTGQAVFRKIPKAKNEVFFVNNLTLPLCLTAH